jgi:3-phenylpropionate/cinnamic acid dioxygenase small subunit
MSDATDQIHTLIHRYAEAVDLGRFERLTELFAHATLRFALGTAAPTRSVPGADAEAMYRGGIILYDDGTPRTRHLVTNTIIDVDEKAGRATARCYNTTLQQAPGHPIDIIATAKYEDTFERVEGQWRFSERLIRSSSLDGVNRDFIGDMSRHTHSAPTPAHLLPVKGSSRA